MSVIRISLIVLFLAMPIRVLAEDVVVFAASSLKVPLDELGQRTGGNAKISYAGSAILAHQINQGAPADVFLSANRAWVDWLLSRGDFGDPIVFAGNRLIYAGPAGFSPRPLDADVLAKDLARGKIGIPIVDAVPLGIYAKQALERMEIWSIAERKLVQTESASATVRLLELGAIDRAILYQSDITGLSLTALDHIDPDLHDPIAYVGVAITPAGQKYVEGLIEEKAQTVFQEFGFLRP